MRQSFTSWAWSRSEDSLLLSIDDRLFQVFSWNNGWETVWVALPPQVAVLVSCIQCTIISLGFLVTKRYPFLLGSCLFLFFNVFFILFYPITPETSEIHENYQEDSLALKYGKSRNISTWPFTINFAQWRYTNQWPFREVVLLLVENWIPIPRLKDVKYHLSCQFLMVLLGPINGDPSTYIVTPQHVCTLSMHWVHTM